MVAGPLAAGTSHGVRHIISANPSGWRRDERGWRIVLAVHADVSRWTVFRHEREQTLTKGRPYVDPSKRDSSTLELQAFASAMVHELRTPLAALSGEVELALLRDRTPAEYRDALSQIGERVTELLALTSDLAFLGYPSESEAVRATARLETILAVVSERYSATPDVTVTTESNVLYTTVIGHENRLIRGLTLLVEHALRHRREDAALRLRVVDSGEEEEGTGAAINLILEASPPGFWPRTWHHLTPSSSGNADLADADAPGLLRLRTVGHIVRGCGGSAELTSVDGSEVVHVRLLRA
jgi:signal transduction histidine kinase